MTDKRNQLQQLVQNFSPQKLTAFFRAAHGRFRPAAADYAAYLEADQPFLDLQKTGEIEFEDGRRLILVVSRLEKELTRRSSKKRQYDLAKKILKQEFYDAGIFVFYDADGRFRFSLVTAQYLGTRRQFSNFRRYTYFVDPALPNKTFLNQIGRADFSRIETIQAAFSIEAVSDEFYRAFKPRFDQMAAAVTGTDDPALQQDFALLLVIRTIFLGFVQKKGWLGDDPRFLQNFLAEYQADFAGRDQFYGRWLKPLFFEALNSPPGRKAAWQNNDFSPKTEAALQMAPYLNGELFKEKRGVDDQHLSLPDAQIAAFFDFLFQYNFTIEENTLYDEELELNPEFLGIIFERLVSKADGAVYTPRIEVDFMCRMALLKWLEKNAGVDKTDLYHLFFREMGTGSEHDEMQKQGDFSPAQLRQLIEKLENVTVCDPAAGSGAFEVGVMRVLDETLENLYSRNNTPADLRQNAPDAFARKKQIIANSLYGVEVKRWAVWINQLRLWLSLFVDMPDGFRDSFDPLLPNLEFKVRAGDSLVQRVGSKTFPVQEHAVLPPPLKRKITLLKEKKRDFFYNRGDDYQQIRRAELDIFQEILHAEIQEKEARIRQLSGRAIQPGLLPDAPPAQAELAHSHSAKAERRRLAAEIEELRAQKESLHEEIPFIWSIEFAEIFFDKGGFDLIIGNPPYVRQEDIADPHGALPPKAYKAALQEMVLLDFPDHFGAPGKPGQFRKGLKPSGRSDLYTYFYVRSLRLLNPAGFHVFICSNSWLDVGYGAWLQQFLLRKAAVFAIVDNHARRSFASADVNTIISLIDAPRPPRQTVDPDHVIRFVAFKQPFENVILSENLLQIEAAAPQIGSISQIEPISTAAARRPQIGSFSQNEPISTVRNNRFRVFSITAGELWAEGSEQEGAKLGAGKYVGDKWGGKYLRAPDIFFTILAKGKGKLVKLGQIAQVRFGIKTGANDFFYLEPLGPGGRPGLLRVRNGAGWEGEIEEEYLKPVIKSPRECRTIQIRPEDLKYRVFMCHKSKEELENSAAVKYIEWGETFRIPIKQGSKKGQMIIGYQNLQTIKGRKRWWDIGLRRIPDLVMVKGPWNRHFVIINSANAYCDQQLYEIFLTVDADSFITGYQANATSSGIFFELEGRRNFGEGILWLAAYEIRNIRVLRDNLEEVQLDPQFTTRIINDIFIECGIDPESDTPIPEQEPNPLPDRKALDDVVFDALGLSEAERKEVYRAVCQLVWERISKAKSVKKRR